MTHEIELRPMMTKSGQADEYQEENLAKYIQSRKIQQIDCSSHVFTAKSDSHLCECGRSRSWSDHLNVEESDRQRASLDTHSKYFTSDEHCKAVTCKSYGEISFEGFGTQIGTPAKYIRIDAETSPIHLWKIMKHYWGVKEPKLIISVTGGAKCEIKPRLIDSFKRGLINAPPQQVTNAWIITGGTNKGVMQFVGDAVRDHTLMTGDRVVALGIATWGIVDNKECLTEPKNNPTVYKKTDLHLNKPISMAPLDPNHSHFILVDNGIERTYGVEIKFRANFENHIERDTKDKQVPVVSLVLGGGINTILTAAETCEQGTPIVVVKESGRAADLIALAFNEKNKFGVDNQRGLTDNLDAIVKKEAVRIMDTNDEGKLTEMIKNIRRLVNTQNMVTVFSLEDDDTKEMDSAILLAILKAKGSPKSQLDVALAWDCVDIARDQLFSHQNGSTWKDPDALQSAMTEALLQDKPAFAQLFLDNGIVLSTFLTKDNLENLYKKVMVGHYPGAGTSFLKEILTEDGQSALKDLTVVGNFICDLVGGVQERFYQDPISMNPERDLFLWAVLLNRWELAELFWKLGRDHIGGALFASCILGKLSSKADSREDIDLSQEMKGNAEKFESLAVGVLNECYKCDKGKSHSLLTRELVTWGKTTLFSLADRGNLMDFMGHSSCQSKLNRIWMGKMALYTSTWKILLGMVLPLMVLVIKFTGNSRASSKLPEKKNKGHKLYRASLFGLKEDPGEPPKVPFLTSLKLYHTAPFVKFCYHAISYVAYLCLFSFFVMTDLRPGTISVYEYIIWAWSATIIMDEFRQLFVASSSRTSDTAAYFSSFWNRVDCLIVTLMIASIILRFILSGDAFMWARMSYVLTLALFYLRIMQLFFVEKNIGPKVIMIRRMVTDLVFFLLLLATVVFAYGIARQALLYPNTTPSWELFGQVISQPFWGIYGELFLEEFEGEVAGCSYNATLYENNPDVPRCPTRSWVAILLHAFYMLLTNILLINLLIAMFSYTFERVQEKSEKVWRFYRYGLIYEYFDKPTLAPPLIIFSHLWRLLKFLNRCNQTDASTRSNDFHERTPDKDAALTAFERAGMAKYLIQKRGTGMVDNGSKVTNGKIEDLTDELKHLKKQMLSFQVSLEATNSANREQPG